MRTWTHRCPDCGIEMKPTGKVKKVAAGFWDVQFWCPVEKEHFDIATREWNDVLNKLDQG